MCICLPMSAKLTISYAWSRLLRLASNSSVPSCFTRPAWSFRRAVISAARGTVLVIFGLTFRWSFSRICCLASSTKKFSSDPFSNMDKAQDAHPGGAAAAPSTPRTSAVKADSKITAITVESIARSSFLVNEHSVVVDEREAICSCAGILSEVIHSRLCSSACTSEESKSSESTS